MDSVYKSCGKGNISLKLWIVDFIYHLITYHAHECCFSPHFENMSIFIILYNNFNTTDRIRTGETHPEI